MKTTRASLIHCGDMFYQMKEEMVSLIAFIGDMTAAMWECIRHPKRLRWKDFLFYMNTCGPDGLPITITQISSHTICFLSRQGPEEGIFHFLSSYAV